MRRFKNLDARFFLTCISNFFSEPNEYAYQIFSFCCKRFNLITHVNNINIQIIIRMEPKKWVFEWYDAIISTDYTSFPITVLIHDYPCEDKCDKLEERSKLST